MLRVRDVSDTSKDIIRLINKGNIYKTVKIYNYKDCRVIYCLTHCDRLHVSASTPHGPASEVDLLYAFGQLTDKPVSDFELMMSERALYLLEKESSFIN